MNIGILSMQRVINHGSFLQSYALKKNLEKYGYVSFLDIIDGEDNSAIMCDSNSKTTVKKNTYLLNRIAIKYYLAKKQKKIICENQREYLKLDKHENKYDCVFIGSDEVFNCSQKSSFGFTTQLFGNIVNAGYVATYAASCGNSSLKTINTYFEEKIRESFCKINKFSVRDSNTEEFVKSLSDKPVIRNLDPVLIYDFENEIVKTERNEDYLLVYGYQNRFMKNEIIKIKEFAKKNKLKTYAVGVFHPWCDKNIPVKPFELLDYFKNAKYIVTETFHGCVLSIKYNKQFVSYVRDSNRNKLEDLLKQFRIEDHIIDCTTDIENEIFNTIDYTPINDYISKERKKAYDYISLCIDECRVKTEAR